jgi:hypothetical protein
MFIYRAAREKIVQTVKWVPGVRLSVWDFSVKSRVTEDASDRALFSWEQLLR